VGYTVDIDTGGTFTDGFFSHGGEFRAVKTPTTPHDLTVCFLDCFAAGAAAFGVSLGELLQATDVVRFSTTIGTNCIIQRDGTKIGLLVTRGHEALAPTADLDGKAPLVLEDMVLGLEEGVAPDGALRRPPDPAEVLSASQALIDRGARCLVVALDGSDVNPANERSVREIIKREYPRDYLGSVPVFLASDISARPGYRERLNAAVLNGYIHGKLTRLLYTAGETLRRNRYGRQLFIGHSNGAVARVAKTRAIDTYNSGPAAGLLGARAVAALCGARHVISADMGGTSFDIGVAVDGEVGTTLRPEIEGLPCNLPMLAIRALGAGGGSIAVVRDGQLSVGPDSAGALPGPACFDLGGHQATVTDANLVLGLLDADSFFGGRKKLDVGKARAAIESSVARPLGVSPEEAALRIREVVEESVAREMSKIGDDTVGPPVMVLYGGAGPLHGCAIADRAGIRKLIISSFSAVFSAYASSLMDVGHAYWRSSNVPLRAGADFSSLAASIAEMRSRAERDMRGEGFAPEKLLWSVELVVRSEGSGREARILAGAEFDADAAPIAELATRAARVLRADGGAPTVTAVGLVARAPIPHFAMRLAPPARDPATVALLSSRAVRARDRAASISVPLYDRSRLGFGHRLVGPALVESDQTTIWVTGGWTLAIDAYDNAILEKAP
jgi:N-methylhydantoinase A/acetophenone carboxylase